MSGGENYFAGALFFSLVTFGTIIKIDGIEGLALGVVGAFLAGLFLRQALSQMFDNAEENNHKLELQIQELKKISGDSNSNVSASSVLQVAEISALVNQNIQDFEKRLIELETVAENNAAIVTAAKKIEDNTSAMCFTLKTLADLLPAELQKISAAENLNRQTLLTAANVLQTLDTLLKNRDVQKEISEMAHVNAEVFDQNKNLIDAAKNLNDAVDNLKSISEQLLTSTTNLRAVFQEVENVTDVSES